MIDGNPTPAEASKLVRQELILDQLRPIEDIIEAARKEVVLHRAACAAAEARGTVDPQKVLDANAAADGVEELLARFDAMADELSGQSKVADEQFDRMHDLLEALRKQMVSVVERLEKLS
jgi:hypothetical protein